MQSFLLVRGLSYLLPDFMLALAMKCVHIHTRAHAHTHTHTYFKREIHFIEVKHVEIPKLKYLSQNGRTKGNCERRHLAYRLC